jgi:hypothetical protein
MLPPYFSALSFFSCSALVRVGSAGFSGVAGVLGVEGVLGVLGWVGVLGVVGVLVGLSPPQATSAMVITRARMSANALFIWGSSYIFIYHNAYA